MSEELKPCSRCGSDDSCCQLLSANDWAATSVDMWNPVSQGNPEKGANYLATITGWVTVPIVKALDFRVDGRWFDSSREIPVDLTKFVTAWREKPEPWDVE